jgi:uncharacterized protein
MKGTVQMKINILPLLRGEKDKITFSYSCEAKDFSPDISEGEININGYIKNFSGYMLLEGDIDMAFSALCGRCAKTSKHSVKTSFSRPVAQKLNQEDDEYILASENGDVDITEAVEEAVFSEMPVRFLCKEDCKGLCPICGVDLNDTSCSCVEEKCDPRLAKLREYLNNLEE